MKFKVIIAGSRGFNDYSLLVGTMDHLLQNKLNIEIVSGTANGADKLGERYAKERGYDIKYCPADWDKFQKSAGFIRNKEMAEYADACVVFWDGISRGSKHMIDLATERNLKVRVVKY